MSSASVAARPLRTTSRAARDIVRESVRRARAVASSSERPPAPEARRRPIPIDRRTLLLASATAASSRALVLATLRADAADETDETERETTRASAGGARDDPDGRSASTSTATSTPDGDGATRDSGEDPWEGSYVKPALSVREYVEEIDKERDAAFATLRALCASSKFAALSNELVLAPTDDVRQAAYYLPWALVKLDEDAGVTTQRAWSEMRDALTYLDATAIDASRYDAEEEDVMAGIDRVERALDALVDSVPAAYR
ncbi:uncharacterized protein MICPUCDRAFT_56676 [Micromonas pusilla CCMP1545]|uniref:Predicted protein n=1 Tax=Micromonas pusilla (strain CCMP1545) TaxID=564608 RepID=C1MMV8_MICPC|nr:uncharacterized protein MICPUCDRAFT_56676 [Micromonas pusilla CCMP1545]EEH58641.1 predicted protein [Micromonas pusilla CCMP1545]|eukprot:XP_003056996.1 predicted protein [Micromonas pusilla CCMP1545]